MSTTPKTAPRAWVFCTCRSPIASSTAAYIRANTATVQNMCAELDRFGSYLCAASMMPRGKPKHTTDALTKDPGVMRHEHRLGRL